VSRESNERLSVLSARTWKGGAKKSCRLICVMRRASRCDNDQMQGCWRAKEHAEDLGNRNHAHAEEKMTRSEVSVVVSLFVGC
jgi:hypothetical protein